MAEPAWSRDNLQDPHAVADKARRVREMFTAIAPAYDLNNRVHSLWRDQAWRRAAVRLANARPGDVVVDVACGTGDLAMAFDKAGVSRVVGVDFTFEMLKVAEKKKSAGATRRRADAGTNPILFSTGDATRLPIADAAADVVSIAFGIRNVAQPQRAVAEFHRILRPGGRLVILEFSLPRNAVVRGMYNFYFNHVLPRTASLIARDRSGAYRYLPRSVNTFLTRGATVEMMRDAGFSEVSVHPLTLGIAVVYRGVRS